ncbi:MULTISPECIES: 1-acylglycerol-3-phosphate O-acyltransferase [unclassified Neisseria]|uniref:1-acylglycerol-3-phosphate O-acyltransferase n=1 Tax=unclassified Neisseria TaxID=2623750 RepID=UPI002664EA23|nr:MULTISPECIES: 1-acylglycerol-3-phosphate O-acyltransferase [unclassified Neisseria]MDO1510248.1 1-acylglycerol-3-phosphate O-acyltransferase [Neisseria sp. MVDL19-042950]MDO1516417.1 1-acylglycerol-3-phosphate O-acyltransferase [Neisseria sp. MVDL18-041461]MDO1563565.1 1-acylglycerol-3-phosphate O-acyltransferase [Neisseria sp. MVDL20-010259]
MSAQKAPLTLRFARLFKLAVWLFKTGRNLNRIDGDDPEQRNQAIITLGSTALQALGIKLDVSTPPEHFHTHGNLVVANHVSWLDIFAMSALYPSSFIAKQEISNWPVLGKMGRNAGTVFINRNSRKDVEPINQAIAAALKSGQNVSFFPEAKTSSGTDVLPFKAALFQSAIDSNAPIQVMALRYYDHLGNRTTEPSYADVSLLHSIWRVISMPELHIRVDFSKPVYPDECPETDRFTLKDIAETFVRQKVREDK